MSSMLNDMPIDNQLAPQFKLEKNPMSMDNSVEYEWYEIKTDNLSPSEQANNWRLQLKNQQVFVNPARAYLEVQFRIVSNQAGGYAALAGGTAATLQSHILTLFDRATLRVGGQLVESVNEAHIAKGLVQPLLHYSQDYASSSGTNEFFYPDVGTADVANTNQGRRNNSGGTAQFAFTHAAFNAADNVAANALNVQENPLHNAGFEKRRKRTNASAYVTCWVPLSALFGFCSIDRVLVNNQFVIELTRSSPEHHILGTAANAQTCGIKSISCWMPNILPKSVVDLALKSSLASGVVSNYLYPHMSCYTIAGGAGVNNHRVITSSEKVTYAFVLARLPGRNETTSVSTTSDVVTTLEVRLNGRAYPSQNYVNLVGDTTDKARAYSDLLRYMARGYDFSSGIGLPYEEWKECSIFAFDMTSQPASFEGQPAQVEIRANTTAAVDWSVCVLSEKRTQIRYDGGSAVVLVN